MTIRLQFPKSPFELKATKEVFLSIIERLGTATPKQVWVEHNDQAPEACIGIKTYLQQHKSNLHS
jgi:hypothetical protein